MNAKILICVMLCAAVLSCGRALACGQRIRATVDLRDGISIDYAVDVPCHANGNLVVLLQYLSDRDMDYFTGRAASDILKKNWGEGYFLYGTLRRLLIESGYSVVAYNAPGVGCQSMSLPTSDNPYCIRQNETSKIQVLDFAKALNSILAATQSAVEERLRRRIILVGHSGASITASDFASVLAHSARGTEDFAFVGISPLISSGKVAMRQQKVDNWIDRMSACKEARNFSTCASAVIDDPWFAAFFGRKVATRMREIIAKDPKALPDAFRTKLSALHAASRIRSNSAEKDVRDIFSAETINEIVEGKKNWGAGLRNYPRIKMIFGSLDISFSPERQIEEWLSIGGRSDDVMAIAGLGHTLGRDRYFGPTANIGFAAVLLAIHKVAVD